MEESENKKQITVDASGHKARLDVWLSAALAMSRGQVQRHIDAGLVTVNGRVAKKNGTVIHEGERIVMGVLERNVVREEEDETEKNEALYAQVEIVAEEKDYLIINKPTGLLTHGTPTSKEGSLAAWLVTKYPEIKKVGESADRPGIVHRLDRLASGLLVVARTQKMFTHLKKQFKDRTVTKQYYALVHGNIASDHDTIDFPIDRGPDGRMVARPKQGDVSLRSLKTKQAGRTALTEFLVKERWVNYTLLDITIHTGRMHQIRVHMYAYTRPVVGDPLYEQKQYRKYASSSRLFLHAHHLEFNALSGERVGYDSPLPEELEKFLKIIT